MEDERPCKVGTKFCNLQLMTDCMTKYIVNACDVNKSNIFVEC